jgi:hypothetical protein
MGFIILFVAPVAPTMSHAAAGKVRRHPHAAESCSASGPSSTPSPGWRLKDAQEKAHQAAPLSLQVEEKNETNKQTMFFIKNDG